VGVQGGLQFKESLAQGHGRQRTRGDGEGPGRHRPAGPGFACRDGVACFLQEVANHEGHRTRWWRDRCELCLLPGPRRA
jgi:hypothetical protein